MSDMPEELRYTQSHEWVLVNEEVTVTVGITDHAQELLGDLVFVEPPAVGTRYGVEEACGVVESVKAASDIYAPVGGEVVEVNEALADAPEVINQDPYGDGWIFKMRPDAMADVDALLDAEAYKVMAEAEE